MKRVILVLFLSFMNLTAYAKPWHAYSGPDLPRNQVAVLTIALASQADIGNDYVGTNMIGQGIYIQEVDGHPITNYWDGTPRPTVKKCEAYAPLKFRCFQNAANHPNSIELLPGKHTIVFFVTIAQPPQNITQDITVEAGKKYKAKLKTKYEGPASAEELMRHDYPIQPVVKYRWWIEID